MKPIKELVIRHEDRSDGYNELSVTIDKKGSIVLEGVDTGEDVCKFFGDWDFEYWLKIPPDYLETVLLFLIKDRFLSVHDMQKWLEERDIPSQFTSF